MPPQLREAYAEMTAEIERLYQSGVTEYKVRRVGNRFRVAPILPEKTIPDSGPLAPVAG